jgi:cell wall-associated NlpC family hydrolase
VRRYYGAWGPPARRYLPLEGLERRSLQWQRERVIAAAARFIGYEYQHHHIPDWNPPAPWPWKHCCAGHNGRGFDCSNFTSFVYNQAFGIHFSSGIEQQARATHSDLNHGRSYQIERVEVPSNYDQRCRNLHTGDLLYIRGRVGGPITHVILWVGNVGRSPDEMPLILDSHGSDVEDDHGRAIPCGVHLRPYRPGSWYDRCTSHAHRLFG